MKTFLYLFLIFILTGACQTEKLQVIETGSITPMPDEWIDKDTNHKVVKLTSAMEGNSLSFYFHNNPFIGDEMVFITVASKIPMKLLI